MSGGIIRLDEVGSTNDYLKERASELPHMTAVIAERQTAGKGRLGKHWQDNGTGLKMSVLLRNRSIESLTQLPLVTGLTVALALEKLTGKRYGLKWSNDVLWENKKLCGILCESRILKGETFVVTGIGMNLAESAEDLDRLNLVYATSLKLATGKNFEKAETARAILDEFDGVLKDFEKNGFQTIRERYKEYCVTLGKEVRVISGGRETDGVAVDISGDGGLICEIDGGLEIIRANEASVRGIYGYA